MTATLVPSRLERATFFERFGGIYENAPWVAEAVWHEAQTGALDDPEALATAMAAAVDVAPHERKLALIRAHPDLAGRAAEAGALTAAS
ncbi:MAG: OHCU decarboxylase, partial [Alphaproteobacteria bacterium]